MFKIFDRSKAASKSLASPLIKEPAYGSDEMINGLQKDMDEIYLGIKKLRLTNSILIETNKEKDIEIIALKAIISNLRKQKVYAGQKFYDPNNHRLPTIYLCARWNEWYMIRNQNQVQPFIMHNSEFQDLYGHYVLMPKQSANIKNLK